MLSPILSYTKKSYLILIIISPIIFFSFDIMIYRRSSSQDFCVIQTTLWIGYISRVYKQTASGSRERLSSTWKLFSFQPLFIILLYVLFFIKYQLYHMVLIYYVLSSPIPMQRKLSYPILSHEHYIAKAQHKTSLAVYRNNLDISSPIYSSYNFSIQRM